jgi:hypothetical protein
VARRKRTKRSNPTGLADLGVFPIAAALAAGATLIPALIPTIAGLFQKAPETPSFSFDPNKYSQDYATVLAAKTQEAIAQQQAQAVVQAEQIRASSNKNLLIYGAIGVAVVVGAVILIKTLRKGK